MFTQRVNIFTKNLLGYTKELKFDKCWIDKTSQFVFRMHNFSFDR